MPSGAIPPASCWPEASSHRDWMPLSSCPRGSRPRTMEGLPRASQSAGRGRDEMQRESRGGGAKSQSSQALGKLVLTVSCPGLLLLHVTKAGRAGQKSGGSCRTSGREGWETFVPGAQGRGAGWGWGGHTTTLRRGSSEFCPRCGTFTQQHQHTDPQFPHLRNGASSPATWPRAVGRRWHCRHG